jgi:predicted  nucleic acid-binding Zn-ribbon protein
MSFWIGVAGLIAVGGGVYWYYRRPKPKTYAFVQHKVKAACKCAEDKPSEAKDYIDQLKALNSKVSRFDRKTPQDNVDQAWSTFEQVMRCDLQQRTKPYCCS